MKSRRGIGKHQQPKAGRQLAGDTLLKGKASIRIRNSVKLNSADLICQRRCHIHDAIRDHAQANVMTRLLRMKLGVLTNDLRFERVELCRVRGVPCIDGLVHACKQLAGEVIDSDADSSDFLGHFAMLFLKI